jgi:hypothetical protein
MKGLPLSHCQELLIDFISFYVDQLSSVNIQFVAARSSLRGGSRPFLLVLLLLLVVVGGVPGLFPTQGAAGPDGSQATPNVTDRGFIVQASDVRSLRLVDEPGSYPVGSWIECAYLHVASFDMPIELAEPVVPRRGLIYDLWCWHRPGDGTVNGYPIVVAYDPSDPVPGLVDVVDVAEFARNQIEFEVPTSELSPAERQVVGVETWLAITSELDYPDVTAQAGLAWATVRTRFRDVVWDLGDGSTVICSEDATRTWDTSLGLDDQDSACTHTYVESSAEDGYLVTATVTWVLEWINNQAPDVFVPWATVSLSTPLIVPVDQLQAVIR